MLGRITFVSGDTSLSVPRFFDEVWRGSSVGYLVQMSVVALCARFIRSEDATNLYGSSISFRHRSLSFGEDI